jgi:holo-[acyl-carrier protein] synthase
MGIDAVDVERFRRLMARRPLLAERIFTDTERSSLSARLDPVPGLAARFAAKEATMKALGTGLGGVRFADVEVVSGGSGAPRLEISGLAASRAEALGIRCWHVSLTHTCSVAAAVVVAD